MDAICINPDKLVYFQERECRDFYLIIPKEASQYFNLLPSKKYRTSNIIHSENFVDIDDILLNKIEKNSDVFLIPMQIFSRPFPKNTSISNTMRVIVLACSNSYHSICEINHFISMCYQANPQKQIEFSNQYFATLERANSSELLIENNITNHTATLLIDDHITFNEIYGFVNKGKQQLVPNGEIALFSTKSPQEDKTGQHSKLKLNGTIVLNGRPLVQQQAPSPYVIPELINQIYQELQDIELYPIELQIKDGVISELRPLNNHSSRGLNMLQSLFQVDSRLRILTEIGCAFNTALIPYPGNSAMNETYSTERGSVHFGIGNRNTLYHIDFVSPATRIRVGQKILIG